MNWSCPRTAGRQTNASTRITRTRGECDPKQRIARQKDPPTGLHQSMQPACNLLNSKSTQTLSPPPSFKRQGPLTHHPPTNQLPNQPAYTRQTQCQTCSRSKSTKAIQMECQSKDVAFASMSQLHVVLTLYLPPVLLRMVESWL
jgi:hypothetical protein